MPTRRFLQGCALLASTFPALAEAQPSTRPIVDALVIPAGDGCLDPAVVAGGIGERLGRREIDANLSVVLRRDVRGVTFVIRRGKDATTVRRIEPVPQACEDMRAAVALTVALALDGTLAESGRRSRSRLGARAGPSRSRGPWLAASIEAVGALGIAPAPALGVAGAGEVGGPGWPDVRVVGLGTLPARTTLGEGEVRVAFAALRLDVCLPQRFSRAQWRGCVGAAAGQSMAAGGGFAGAQTDETFWSAAAGRLDVRLALFSFLSLEVGLEAFVPLVRPRFDVRKENGAIVASKRLPPFGAALSLGPVFRIR